jgi:hypothetical protein
MALGHHKRCKWPHVPLNAGSFQCRQVLLSLFDRDNGPGVPGSGEQGVHDEAGDTSVTVGKGVKIAE